MTIRKFFTIILRILFVIAVLICLGVGILSLTEYKPADVEDIEINDSDTFCETSSDSTLESTALETNKTIKLVSWNIGYGTLGENADFFMDGGEGVKTADKELTETNVGAISDYLKSGNFDLINLQEIDTDSTRSNHFNEYQEIGETLGNYNGVFTNNFKCIFVPYPIPPIGKVDSGLATYSNHEIASAARISLPCPFTWPTRICNLKRCVEITRYNIEGSNKQFVMINAHLEAYDSGEGKKKQTAMLKKLMDIEAADGNYVVVMGDFNQQLSNVDTSAYKIYDGMWTPGVIDVAYFGTDYSLLMDADVPTCRSLDKPYAGADKSTFQYYVIDGAMVTNNIEVKKFKTISMDFVNSDHNPVQMEIVLR